jgi:hypothetical protein
MSKIALDLKDFMHVKSDEKATTLRHKQGHLLKIAHNVLSKDAQEQLKALAGKEMAKEDHGKVIMKAKGGETTPTPTPRDQSDEYQDKMRGLKEGATEEKSVGDKLSEGFSNLKKAFTGQEYAEGGGVHNAYEAGLPCQNPNCKSHGKPHPNCKCYGGFARGGVVQSACDAKSYHHPDCDYYADGGAVTADKEHEEYLKHKEKERKENHDKFMDNHRKMMQPKKQHYAEGTNYIQMPDEQEPKMYGFGGKGEDSQPQSEQPEDSAGKITIAPDGTIQVPQQPQAQAQPMPERAPAAAPKMAPQPQEEDQSQGIAPAPQPKAQPQSAPQPMQQAQQAPPTTAAQMIPVPSDIQNDPEAADMYRSHFQEHKQEMMQERAAFAQDIANGHITPKTYHELFAEKSTLGKIGTLFGLLLGGASAGITHQPNAVMQMMDNEITRDLKAQEESKNNAMNYLKVNQQHLTNQANIKNVDANTKAQLYALSQTQMLQASFDSLVKKVGKMPDGPAKIQAQQVLGQVYQKVGDKINNIEDLAAGAAAFNKLMVGSSGGGGGSDSGLSSKIAQLKLMGPDGQRRAEDLEQKTISGVPGVQGQVSPRPIPQHVRDKVVAMQTLDDKSKDLLHFIDKHKGINFDRWSPATRAEGYQKVEEMKNFYNDSINGGALTEGRLGWYDEQFGKKAPTDILPQLLGQTAKFKEIMRSNTNRRDILLKGAGFTPKQQAAPESQGEASTIERMDPKSGRIVIYDANTKKPIRFK